MSGIAATGPRDDEGFVNLGALQPGSATRRDAAGYSEWLDIHSFRRGR